MSIHMSEWKSFNRSRDKVRGLHICTLSHIDLDVNTVRFVLADTSQLHTKVAEMGQRIRQLEDALAIFQSGVSNETHPLLRDNLLSIKFGPEKGYVPEKHPTVRKESLEPPIDAFGAMALGDSGEAKYFGPSAGSEVRAETVSAWCIF